MACYYYIKLPGGGDVRIPANLIPISKNNKEEYDSLIEVIENHYSKEENLNDDSQLIEVLKKFDTGLHINTLKSIIKKSNKDNLIQNINNKLKELPEVIDLITALRQNILFKKNNVDYRGPNAKKYGKISMNEFLDKLNEPIHKQYLSNINNKGLLGIYTPAQVIKSINDKIEDNEDLGIRSEALLILKRLLKSYYKGDSRKKKSIYSIKFGNDINDAMIIKDESLQDSLLFYNEDNDLSLFMGLLKNIGLQVDEDQLLQILQKHNDSVSDKSGAKLNLADFNKEKFFIGEFIKEKDKLVFIEPQFNKLFSYKKIGTKAIEEIVELMIPFIKRDNETDSAIRSRITSLLTFLKPDRYAEGLTATSLKEEKEFDDKLKNDKELTIQERAVEILPMISKNNINFHYNKRISKTLKDPKDIFHYINSNVRFGEDLILVNQKSTKTGEEFTRYIIPTKIRLTDDGVVLSGFANDNGKYLSVYNGTLEPDASGIEIIYRKLADKNPIIISENAEPLTNEESITIITDTGFISPELVREAAVRGAVISVESAKANKEGKKNIYNYIVKQKYPGAIIGNKQDNLFSESPISDERVKKIKTHKDLFFDSFTDADVDTKTEILKNRKLVSTNKTFFPLEKGDIIRYTDEKNKLRYNRVLSISDTDVFILIKTEKGYYINNINKNLIDRIYKSEQSIRKGEILNVLSLIENLGNDYSIKDHNYSYFTNYEMAGNGDFITIPLLNNTYDTIKITNKELKQGISFKLDKNKQLSYEYVRIPDDLSGASFLTTRLIFSDNATNTAELNNLFISTEKGTLTENEEWTEIIYAIPEEYNLSELKVLDSGTIVRGKVLLKSDLTRDFKKQDPNYIDEQFEEFLNNKLEEEGFKNITKEASAFISNMRNKKDEGLFIKVKGGYRVRYNKSLYQTDFTQDTNFKEQFLKQNSFIVLKESIQDENGNITYTNKSGRKMYRIVGRSNDILTLEYNAYNNEGKLLSIYKTLDLTKEKEAIKWLYVYGKLSDKLKEFELEKKAKAEKKTQRQQSKERKDILHSLKDKFQNIFQIKVELENHDSGQLKKKKAWIISDALKKPYIVLNLHNDNTSEEDLIHEYLHLFLIALKYSPQKKNQYEQLLLNYKSSFVGKSSSKIDIQKRIDLINQTNNITILEELFVEDISSLMANQKYQDLEELNYINFLEAINSSLEALELDPLDLDNSSILNALTTKMSDVFPEVKSKLKQKNLVLFESNFRNWLNEQIDKNKIKIECL